MCPMSQGRDTPWCLHLLVLLIWDAWSWDRTSYSVLLVCHHCRGRTPMPVPAPALPCQLPRTPEYEARIS